MLSFESPVRLPVFHRIVVPCDDSSDEDNEEEEAVNASSAFSVNTDALELQSDVTKSKTSRKRCRNEPTWKRNVIKKARLTGSSYTNYRGVAVPAKHPATDMQLCHCKSVSK